jgi:hypothetical protein
VVAQSGVQVVVRVRPFNSNEEKASNVPVVTTNSSNGEVTNTFTKKNPKKMKTNKPHGTV